MTSSYSYYYSPSYYNYSYYSYTPSSYSYSYTPSSYSYKPSYNSYSSAYYDSISDALDEFDTAKKVSMGSTIGIYIAIALGLLIAAIVICSFCCRDSR